MRISDWSSDVCSSDLELLLAGLGRTLAQDAAAAHRQDAVGETANLVELHGDQQDRLAGVAHGDELAVNEFDGADVDAARRLADQQHQRVALHLAGQHGFEEACICVAQEKDRSEEHTSELQSLMRNSYAVFCLKKKKQQEKKRSQNR